MTAGETSLFSLLPSMQTHPSLLLISFPLLPFYSTLTLPLQPSLQVLLCSLTCPAHPSDVLLSICFQVSSLLPSYITITYLLHINKFQLQPGSKNSTGNVMANTTKRALDLMELKVKRGRETYQS